MHVCDVHFSWINNKFDPLGVVFVFGIFKPSCFFDPTKEATPLPKKRLTSGSPFFERCHRTSLRPHADRKSGPIPSFRGGPKAQSQRATLQFKKKQRTNQSAHKTLSHAYTRKRVPNWPGMEVTAASLDTGSKFQHHDSTCVTSRPPFV